MMDSDGLMNNLLVVLHGMPNFSGARFIESLAAKWTDQLVDRYNNAVREPVRQYVGQRGIPRIWAGLPPGEAHWRVLFSELYMHLWWLKRWQQGRTLKTDRQDDEMAQS
jgi:hypothetical protein